MIFSGYKTEIHKQFRNDFQLSEQLLNIIRGFNLEVRATENIALPIQYVLSRQLQTFDGLVTLCKNGNAQTAAILVRVMIEDFLTLEYWRAFPRSEETWFNKRVDEAKKVADRLRVHFLHKPDLLEGIDVYEDVVTNLEKYDTDDEWKRFEKRMKALANKLNVSVPGSVSNKDLTGIFIYDVLYRRFSQFVHPTGLEAGRYIEWIDDSIRILLEPSVHLISEVLYDGMVFLCETFRIYLSILQESLARTDLEEIESEIEKWRKHLKNATFLTIYQS